MNQDLGIGYARKSSEQEDRQIPSIADQLKGIKELEEKYGIPIIVSYGESKSAKIAGLRPDFNDMIRRIKKGEANTLYVDVINRITRNAKEAGEIIDLLDTGVLKQIIAPNAAYNKDTNSEMLWIEFMSSTKFSKDLSKVVKERLKRKAERGDYPGQAVPGYKNTPNRLKGERKIIEDKKRWDLMRKWFDLVITGNYTVEESLAVVTKLGLTGKNGKPISRSAAYALLRNIFYTGNFTYGGTTYPGNHKPMITMAEWVKIQQLLDKKGKKGAYTVDAEKEKEFQGMLKCGECGATITMSKHTKHYKNGTSQTFWYYQCTKKLGACKQRYMASDLFEPQVKEYILSLELNPNFSEWIKKVLKRRNAHEFNLERRHQILNSKKLEEITNRKENLYAMKIDGLFNEEEYQKRKRELLIEEAQLRESLQKPVTAQWESVLDNTIDFATSVMKLFEQGDIFTRQMVLRILGLNLIMEDKKVYIEAKTAFVFLRGIQNEVFAENMWLEPRKTTRTREDKDYSSHFVQLCALERT